MASVPDLTNLLCLDAKFSSSPFGGQHRTIMISRDFTNSGDFVISSLLQHFCRREPNTPVLFVTLSHDWSNYSSRAAKCGFNLRRTQNGGVFEIVNVMSEYLDTLKNEIQDTFDPCKIIQKSVTNFVKSHASEPHSANLGARVVKPLIVIIDDLSILLTLGSKPADIYRLFAFVDKSLRDRSKEIQSNALSHFIVQTMEVITSSKKNDNQAMDRSQLNYITANLQNLCDLILILRPLSTGYSTRIDGTITINDNRLPASNKQTTNTPQTSLFTGPSLFSGANADIGVKKAYFFKVSDRRVRLTSSALVF